MVCLLAQLFRFLTPRRTTSPAGLVIAGEVLPWDDCCKGIFAFGRPGAGKSFFLLNLIRQLCGRAFIIVTTVKSTDFNDIQEIHRRSGAKCPLIRLGPGSPDRIDPGEFFTRTLPGGSPRVLAKVFTMTGDVLTSSGGKGGERFWEQLIADVEYFCILLVLLATGKCDIRDVYQVAQSLPSSLEELASDGFYDRPCGKMLNEAASKLTPESRPIYDQVLGFITRIAGLGSKARTAGTQGAMSTLAALLTEFGPQVSGGSTIDLAECERSKAILVIDGAPSIRFDAGRAFNFINACAVQYYCLSRDPDSIEIPTTLFRDEAAWNLSPAHDAQIQAISRSLKLASVSAGQSIPIMTAGLGGDERARHEATAFVSLHGATFFFGNTCPETGSYGEKLCGVEPQVLVSSGGRGGEGNGFLADALGVGSCGWSQQVLPRFPAHMFGELPVGVAVMVADGTHKIVDFRERRR